MDFFNKFLYWGKLDIKNNIYEEIELKAKELYYHIDDFKFVYELLKDYQKKKTLYAILNNWYNYDFLSTDQTREKTYDDYFDLDIVKCNKDEVFVDLGSYTGDTILSYFKNYGNDNYKKIYCYDITKESMDILKNNLKSFPNIIYRLIGIGDKEEKMKIKVNETSNSANLLINDSNGDIDVTTLDIDILEPITTIKADIEGYEQKAIIGAKNHIMKEKPKLLISVYHKNEDLWKIPKMIYELNKNYKFYLRFTGSIIYPTEITLYAI